MPILLRKILLFSLFIVYIPIIQAELTIEISKGVETATPIAIVPFGWKGQIGRGPADISAIIKADLSRSGLFKTLENRNMLSTPTQTENIRFRDWRALGQEYLVIGSVNEKAGAYQVQFQLLDVYKGKPLMGYRLTFSKNKIRKTAHQISDLIYEKLTGIKGIFGTNIAYITSITKANNQKLYKLLVADADGFNPITIAKSSEPLMSPAWSPDGKKIAYVSFENKRSAIYIQVVATGKRTRVAAYKGINGAPAFSPDGKRLALTLSKGGSPDIYILDLINKSLRKLTKSYGIDTEPAWAPDGQSIIYTSNRGGKPQLYSIPARGGNPKRLTFDGDYNARGQYAKNGKSIAMVHANRGDYRIAVMDLASRTINVLTAGRFDESPSFSPNGDMLLYASRKGRKSVLSAISIDGRMQQNLIFSSGEVREPAWSPQ